MNKRIKIFCLILSIIYVSVVIYSIFDVADSFIAGYKQGQEEAKDSSKNIQTLHLKLKPIEGGYVYPEKVVNTLTGQEMKAEIGEYKIKFDNSENPLPVHLKVFRGIIIFLAVVILAGLIYLPFLFFSIIKSGTKGKMLEHKTIRKIQQIGYLLIIYYIINVVICLSDFMIAKHAVALEKYRFIIDFSDFGFLFLGLVTLLLAEILKVSVQLKEEQDLTI
ncbi:Protein of unknown function (DUF2975) [Dysgonomonas alginatilytica]|uniref:DUF2975 family protein n=1 Tax=Dysgonomonas alginatilytica TaxID=1605892 RepID=A0A2V3PTY1_9BACT|nr:DUF2975 domain-containing protein [Dysgonomonas alginatilytica]PXV69069.1 Protein of unknown function (DUF2975) [Dysgonomonas alginatilytica]